MDERKVSKARMWLVTSRCPRIRAPSSIMPRGKMAAPYSFFSRHRLRMPSSVRSDPAQCRRHKTVRSMVGLSWFLTRSSIQVQAWPVHQTRPNRGVGLRRLGPWDSKTSSSHEVSRDSQRLRHWTPDEPVDALLMKADRAPPRRSVSPLPIADSAHSGSPSFPADSPCLSFARSPRSPLAVLLLQFHFSFSALEERRSEERNAGSGAQNGAATCWSERAEGECNGCQARNGGG